LPSALDFGYDAGGMAHQMHELIVNWSFEQFAFAVVPRIVATGKFAFAHELGHLMGAQHDSASSGGAQRAFSYSHGHVGTNGDDVACIGHDCAVQMGSEIENNSQSLDDTATIVRSFR
jgi:Metallo-peptidase family M12